MKFERISFPLHADANLHRQTDLAIAVDCLPEAFGTGWTVVAVDAANHRITAERHIP